MNYKLSNTLFHFSISLILTALFGILVPSLAVSCLRGIGFQGDCGVGIWGIFVFGLLVFFLFFPLIPRGRLNPKGKAVLITGCDSGFGLLLAKQLDAAGMYVFAGCYLKDKGGEGSKLLEETGSDRLKVVQLDVTDEQSVLNTAEFIKSNLPPGEKGLWGLVNNAGRSAFGDVEWSSIDLFKYVADVNLWGVIRITKACLPMIRRSQGRVVVMASGFGRIIAPSRSVYGVSKWGVEGFATCLRYEMKQWGVKVSIIEPGNYIAGTNIFTPESVSELAKKMWQDMGHQVKVDYGREYFDKKVLEMVSYCNKGMRDLTPVTDAYADALLSRHPYNIYNPMSPYWQIRLFIMTHLPSFIGDNLYIYKGANEIKTPNKSD